MDKAFDRVPRNTIWEILAKRKVNNKLIAPIKSLYKNTNNRVVSINNTSESFRLYEDIRQGRGLSPLLFLTYTDEIIKSEGGIHRKPKDGKKLNIYMCFRRRCHSNCQ